MILAIVPARGGSKGIPHKNLAICAGKPLLLWTLDAVMESKLIDEAIVSSDDAEIRAAVRWEGYSRRGIYSLERPARLAQDRTSTEAVLEWHLSHQGQWPVPPESHDVIVLLQPTSPVRTGKQIDEAITQLQTQGVDSLLSVVESHSFLWRDIAHPSASYNWNYRSRRQEILPQYEENGSIYVFTMKHWERQHNRLGGKIGLFIMPEECRVQVDTRFDLWMAEAILERQAVRVV